MRQKISMAVLLASLSLNLFLWWNSRRPDFLRATNANDEIVFASLKLLKQAKDTQYQAFRSQADYEGFETQKSRCLLMRLTAYGSFENRDRVFCFDKKSGEYRAELP